jgi:single-strand DNA-binding protein
MADLKLPELNCVIIAGNLTKDPVFRKTGSNVHVVNFSIASNRRYRDTGNVWQEEVCFVGVVAWDKLADSCVNRLRKGSSVLVDGELQSRVFKCEDGSTRNVIEIKARRIQFLNKRAETAEHVGEQQPGRPKSEDEPCIAEDESFDKFILPDELHGVHERTDIHHV